MDAPAAIEEKVAVVSDPAVRARLRTLLEIAIAVGKREGLLRGKGAQQEVNSDRGLKMGQIEATARCEICGSGLSWAEAMVQETFTRNGALLTLKILCRDCHDAIGAIGYRQGPPLGGADIFQKGKGGNRG